ncbi:MAG TPA: hypothetical protein VGG03_06400 [Thermoanaerobaculia bacterium]
MYALFILRWHQNIRMGGVARIQGEARASYTEALRRFSEMDLHDPEVQRQLARTQVSGIFEYFYGERCDPDLWYNLARDLEVDLPCPQTMGEAGRKLLDLLEALGSMRAPERSEVPRDRERLLAAADEFYKDLPSEKGLGGKFLLLSCSLERGSPREVELRHPEELGFHFVAPGTQRDGLIDGVRSGRVTVLEAVGGPQDREAHYRREEG